METIEQYLMYLRKSRADSDNETVEDVLAKHEKILQEFAVKTFGKPIPEHNIYREVVSGETIDQRPEMKKILSLVANTAVYAGVLVVEPQRLTRGDLLDCGTIERVFRYNNIEVLTPSGSYNLANTQERRFFEMQLQQGNDYLEYTKAILNRGRIQSVKEGNFIGQKPPFGYDKTIIDGHHTLKPNADADTIRLMYHLFVNENLGTCQIASELDRRGLKPQFNDYWSNATIRDMLRNPVYIGKIRWNWKKEKKFTDETGNTVVKRIRSTDDLIIVNGLHQAIIDEELFNKAQEKIGKNARTPGNSEMVNPFSSLVKCSNCGRSINYRTYKNKEGKQRGTPRMICSNQAHCQTPSMNYYEFEKSVIQSLKMYITDFEYKVKNDDGNSYKIQEQLLKNLIKELDELQGQQNKLYEFLEKGIYSEEVFLQRQDVLNKRKKELEAGIEQQRKSLPAAIDYEDKIKKVSDAISALQNESIAPKDKNKFLKEIIERIEYTAEAGKANKYKPADVSIDVFLR